MRPSSISPCITTAKPVGPRNFYRKHFGGERELAVLAAVSETASKQGGRNV